MFEGVTPIIGLYGREEASYRPHDPRATGVARRVGAVVREQLPELRAEHVGSTAIPGCAGRGVVDLMIPVPPGQLELVKALLHALGFQRQVSPPGYEPWPESRPMRVGKLEHDGTCCRLHVHVIPTGSPEVEAQRCFRERLSADPKLRDAYVARKREILSGGHQYGRLLPGEGRFHPGRAHGPRGAVVPAYVTAPGASRCPDGETCRRLRVAAVPAYVTAPGASRCPSGEACWLGSG